MTKILAKSALFFLTTALVPTVLHAQAAEDDARAGAIEDIVVTAQRRTESLQNVPIAITAITAAAIEKSGVSDTNDLQRATPGLVMNTFRSTVTPYLRGVGTQNTAVGEESSIATYVDGVYISAMAATTFGLNNIERVEVLKGPQGTLFGRNATGGLLHVITKDPSQTTSVSGKIGYANYNTVSGSVYATTGLTEKVAVDVAAYFSHQGNGWGHNISGIAGLDGVDVNRTREWAVRSKVLAEPTDSIRITLAGDYTLRRSDIGTTRSIYPYSSLTCRSEQVCNIIAARPATAAYGSQRRVTPFVAVNGGTVFRGTVYDTQAGLPPKANTKQYGASLKVEIDLGGPQLTSTTAARRAVMKSNFDQDGGPTKFVDAIFNEKTTTIQQELLVVGDVGRIDYTGGLFYFYAKAGNRPLAFDSAVSASLRGISRFSQLHTKSYAAFGQATYHVTDTTGITAGVRYTIDDRDVSGYNLLRSTNTIIPAGTIPGVQGPLSRQKTFRKLTYRFAIDQKINDNVLVYASYSRGFKSGVFNATSYEALPVNPETLDSAEVGIKSDLLDRRLRFNLSAFHYKYDQLQLQRVDNGQTVNINAGSAKVKGVELEIVASPPVATGQLTFSVNASYLHARFGTFVNMPILVPRLNLATNTPASPFGNITVAGTTDGLTLPRAPSYTLTVNGDYSIPVGSGELGFNVNYYLNAGYFGDIDNRVAQKSYGLLNAQISYGINDDRWKLTGWIRNITDKVYFNQFSNSGIGDQVSPGAPRTYGATLGFKF